MNPEWAAILWGLASAASWGAGDFSGGVASKRAPAYTVIFISQILSVFFLAGLAIFVAEPFPPLRTVVDGGLAGFFGLGGLLALYQGLATRPMGVVAPLTAVVAAGVPVFFGALIEGLPGSTAMLGFGCAFAGVWLIARGDQSVPIRWRDLDLPVLAGLGFSLFFIFIDRASATAVYWPLVGARLASIGLLLLFLIASRRPVALQRSHLPLLALTGLLETGGNVFFALATAAGRLDVASVLASLYPAATVLLARAVLKEELSQWQWLGVAVTLLAVLLIAA